jgi:hypothetical protein
MDIELGGHTYRAGTIDARTQFHIVRRLGPVLSELVPAVKANESGDGLSALPALAGALAKISDVDADYVLFGLLKVVSRRLDSAGGWGPVCAGTTLMYDDITMPLMLQLAWQSFQQNCGSFFTSLPSASTAAVPVVSAP